LYIYGASNTKKTTLIIKPLISFFGRDNIGFIINVKNFKFQDLINKMLVLGDEFKYNSLNSSEYLKLFSGEELIVEKKYHKEHVKLDSLPTILVSNNRIFDKNIMIQESFTNRMEEIEFFKNNNDDFFLIENIDTELKKEEPSILIYCNKVFFNEFFNSNKEKNKITKASKYFQKRTSVEKKLSTLKIDN
jgi:hypothetical protein